MGPAVTLEKSNIGAKRYLPLPQVMPKLVQSTRRHSGSISGYLEIEESHRKSHFPRDLRRQCSFDSVLARGKTDVILDDGIHSTVDIAETNKFRTLFSQRNVPVSKVEQTPKFNALSCKNIWKDHAELSEECLTAHTLTPSKQTSFIDRGLSNRIRDKPDSEQYMSPYDCKTDSVKLIEPGICSLEPTFLSCTYSGDESTESASSRSDIHNIIKDLETSNSRLTQRASILLKRIRHVHNRGMHLNFEKYLHQLQTELKRHRVPLKTSNETRPPPPPRIGFEAESTVLQNGTSRLNLMSTMEEKPSLSDVACQEDFVTLHKDILNVVDKLGRSVDPDVTDESSDQETSGNECREDFSPFRNYLDSSNSSWVSNQAGAFYRWRHYKQKIAFLDMEIRKAKAELNKLGGRRSKANIEMLDWTSRVFRDSSKIVLSRSLAARCIPYVQRRKRKVINVDQNANYLPDTCNLCTSQGSLAMTLSASQFKDPCRISQVIWKRWSLPVHQRKFQQQHVSSSAHLTQRSYDSLPAPLPDFGKEQKKRNFHKSKSATKLKRGSKPSRGKIGTEISRRTQTSNYDINDVILLPTNSSSMRLNASAKRKEIDVPTWRLASCHLANQEMEFEDTSDEAYIRRHLELEIKEKKHRIPEASCHRKPNHSRDSSSSGADQMRVFPRSRRRQTTCSSLDGSDCFADDRGLSRLNCFGDGYNRHAKTECFDWSSVSHQSDDTSGFQLDEKSLDGASWLSVANACGSSDLSTDSVLPCADRRGSLCFKSGWKHDAERLKDQAASNDSCSTASACSPANSDL